MRKLRGFCASSVPLRPMERTPRPMLASMARLLTCNELIFSDSRFMYETSASFVGRSLEATGFFSRFRMLSWNQLQPDSATRSPQQIRASRDRMAMAPYRRPHAPHGEMPHAEREAYGVLLPAQQLEHFVLNALDVRFTQARVDDLEGG